MLLATLAYFLNHVLETYAGALKPYNFFKNSDNSAHLSIFNLKLCTNVENKLSVRSRMINMIQFLQISIIMILQVSVHIKIFIFIQDHLIRLQFLNVLDFWYRNFLQLLLKNITNSVGFFFCIISIEPKFPLVMGGAILEILISHIHWDHRALQTQSGLALSHLIEGPVKRHIVQFSDHEQISCEVNLSRPHIFISGWRIAIKIINNFSVLALPT